MMNPLKQKIIEKIKREGPISFETFMALALYDPEFGYYTKPSAAIGKAGDFYTSPHLHRIFGIMMGKQIEEMWAIMGKPDRFRIVEMGAGMGHLAKDMLDYLCTKEVFGHMDYLIVELNPAFRQRQKELLSEYSGQMRWHSTPGEVGTVTGCILTNELLDALPAALVVMRDELKEIYVSLSGPRDNTFTEVEMPCRIAVASYMQEFSLNLPAGYRTEIGLKIKDWLLDVYNILERGFILTIDYGYCTSEYYDEERSKGTLLCYYRHQLNEDPYEHIGEQDITVHVNFSALKKWGEELVLRTDGYCPQGTYLVSLGIDQAITECSPDIFELAKIKGLIFPQGMGASHQVMVQSKGIGAAQLRGFTLRNRVGSL